MLGEISTSEPDNVCGINGKKVQQVYLLIDGRIVDVNLIK